MDKDEMIIQQLENDAGSVNVFYESEIIKNNIKNPKYTFLNIILTLGDGNCLFNAMCLALYDLYLINNNDVPFIVNEITPEQIRKNVCDFYKSEYFKNIILNESPQGIYDEGTIEYLLCLQFGNGSGDSEMDYIGDKIIPHTQNVCKDRQWGSIGDILVLAYLYKINIILITEAQNSITRADESTKQIYKLQRVCDEKNTIYLHNIRKVHYQYIRNPKLNIPDIQIYKANVFYEFPKLFYNSNVNELQLLYMLSSNSIEGYKEELKSRITFLEKEVFREMENVLLTYPNIKREEIKEKYNVLIASLKPIPTISTKKEGSPKNNRKSRSPHRDTRKSSSQVIDRKSKSPPKKDVSPINTRKSRSPSTNTRKSRSPHKKDGSPRNTTIKMNPDEKKLQELIKTYEQLSETIKNLKKLLVDLKENEDKDTASQVVESLKRQKLELKQIEEKIHKITGTEFSIFYEISKLFSRLNLRK